MNNKFLFIFNSILFFGILCFVIALVFYGRIDISSSLPVQIVSFCSLSVYVCLFILQYRIVTTSDLVLIQKIQKIQKVFVAIVVLVVSIGGYLLGLAMGPWALAVFEIFGGVIVISTIVSFLAVKIIAKSNQVGILILFLIIIGFFTYRSFVTSDSFEACTDLECKYKFFYEDPSLCRGTYYLHVCFTQTAMKFNDATFCDNIKNEENINRPWETVNVDEKKERDRCKQWVEYYGGKDFPTTYKGMPPWANDYPPK